MSRRTAQSESPGRIRGVRSRNAPVDASGCLNAPDRARGYSPHELLHQRGFRGLQIDADDAGLAGEPT